MWHDTMLSSCRPAWDFSHSCITENAQTTGSLKLSSCLKPKLKLKRARAVPSIAHGGRIFLVSQSRTMSPHVGHGVAVSVPAQKGRPVVMAARSTGSSLTVTLTAVITKDADISGHASGDAGMPVFNLAEREQDIKIAESEKLRRHRISVANKGKVPWNKGCKHSAETIKRIKEKTSAAMQSPTVTTSRSPSSVMAKLRLNARHSQTNETKGKIRDKLKHRWDTKKRIRGYQEIMLDEWKNCVAEGGRRGGFGEEEMQWKSYSVLKKKLRADAAALSRLEKTNNGKMKATRSLKSEQHRLKISAAIRAKWEDPEYKLKVKRGMFKNSSAIKAQKRTQRRTSIGNSITSEAGCIKGPLDHGFVTAVMMGEKKRQQKENVANEQKDKHSAVSAGKTKLRARNRKVDLLKRCSGRAESEKEDFSEDDIIQGLAVSARHSFVDPRAGEKLFRLKRLQVSRCVMDERRKEATHIAKMLMAEAEQAAQKLEAAACNNKFAQASLDEIYRLMAEAEHFIQAAEFLHEDIDCTKSDDGVLWRSTTAPCDCSILQARTTSQGKHRCTSRQGDKNEFCTHSGEIHGHDIGRQSGQDIALGMKTTSAFRDGAQIMMFGNGMMEKAVWNVHNPFTDELHCRSRCFSIVGLFNGKVSRKIGIKKQTESMAHLESRHLIR